MRKIRTQHAVVAGVLDGKLAGTVPLPFVVLNADRRIVFANAHAVTFFGRESAEAMLGFRPGEEVYCVHALEASACGTSSFCAHCGTVKAVLGAQQTGTGAGESNILTKRHGRLNALNLKVHASALSLDGETYTIVYLQDISKERDRELLEQFFLHDALNALGGIRGAAQLLGEGLQGEARELNRVMTARAGQLVRDVEFLQLFFSAEENTLELETSIFDIGEFLHSLQLLCASASYAEDNPLVVDEGESGQLNTDRGLLQRAMENLVKNALEASAPEDAVHIGHILHHDAVHFYVKSRPLIPRHVQAQLFQRTFSTKGRGRGIGAYSARLFVTNYLRGSISFESTPESGTVFYVRIPRS